MNSVPRSLKTLALGLLFAGLWSGCESTEGGGGGSVSGGVYYGVGFYDPWYYGGYHTDIIVTPPPGGGVDAPPRPAHPIATPPMSGARPTPMPSIPSTPRVSARR